MSNPLNDPRLFPDPEGVLRLYADLSVSMGEMKTWEPGRIRAFFYGLTLAMQAREGTL